MSRAAGQCMTMTAIFSFTFSLLCLLPSPSFNRRTDLVHEVPEPGQWASPITALPGVCEFSSRPLSGWSEKLGRSPPTQPCDPNSIKPPPPQTQLPFSTQPEQHHLRNSSLQQFAGNLRLLLVIDNTCSSRWPQKATPPPHQHPGLSRPEGQEHQCQ